jgi:hypothetical protein
MSDYKWEEVLRHSVNDNKILANHLKHIPKLKDADNWDEATFIGRVDYAFKYSKFNGGLVKLNGRIYYINEKQIQVLASYYNWNTGKFIRVVVDEEEEQ